MGKGEGHIIGASALVLVNLFFTVPFEIYVAVGGKAQLFFSYA